MTDEEWSWSKAFGGFLSGKRYGKDLIILVRQLILITIFVTIGYGIYNFVQSQKGATPKAPTVINAEGAEAIDNSTTKADFQGFTLFGIKVGPFGGTNQ